MGLSMIGKLVCTSWRRSSFTKLICIYSNISLGILVDIQLVEAWDGKSRQIILSGGVNMVNFGK